jgi:hypothetical protein
VTSVLNSGALLQPRQAPRGDGNHIYCQMSNNGGLDSSVPVEPGEHDTIIGAGIEKELSVYWAPPRDALASDYMKQPEGEGGHDR